MLKISIVVPVYNTSKYLCECLDSLINQSYNEIEIICVDDGSTDNSLEILNEYKAQDSRVMVLTKDNEGKGAASARNMGFDYSNGEYILFLDSDDVFEINMVEKLVDRINETGAEVVIYNALRFDSKEPDKTYPYSSIDLSKSPDKLFFNVEDCADYIYQISDLVAWNKIYSRKLLVENNLRFEAIPISDDQYIPSLSLVMAKRISVVNEKFVKYRFNTGTSQCDNRCFHPEAAYQATYSIVKRLKEIGKYELVKKSYTNMAVRLMREYFDIMKDFQSVKFLYNKYNDELFPMLELNNVDSDYFYDKRLAQWYEMITGKTLEDILLMSARGYGANMITAILRFKVPYDKIKQGSEIVLVGKGLIGRYWYAQLLLSNYARVVLWVDKEEDISSEYNEMFRLIAE